MSTANSMTSRRANQKSGYRHPEARTHRHQPVACGAVAYPSDDARRDADQHREEHAADGQCQGHREPGGDTRGDAHAGVEQRLPKVSVDDPVEPTQILLPEGLVEVELAGDEGDLVRRGMYPPGEREGGVAGEDQDEAEDTE